MVKRRLKNIDSSENKKSRTKAISCEVCGEDDIEKDGDGYYYCELCQSRYKNVRSLKQSKGAFLKRKIIKNSQLAKTINYGDMWTSNEGFNIILCTQVEALIKLGVSSKLKDTVLKLWTLYLCKTGSAFAEDEQSPWKPPFSMCLARSRDIQVAWMGKKALSRKRTSTMPDVTSPRRSNRLKTQTDQSEKKAESASDAHTPVLNLQLEYLQRSIDENDDVDKSLLESVEKLKGMLGKRRRTLTACAHRRPEFMTMPKTVAFCYLGMVLLQEQVLMSDIVWWIREGTFPYLDASHCLPVHMKFQHSDYQTFSPRNIPTLWNLYLDLGKIVRFLDIPVPPAVELEPVIARFVIRLDLPVEMCSLVTNLMSVRPPTMQYVKEHRVCIRYPSAETRALVLIVMTLKIIFGLDGATERKCSLVARSMNARDSGLTVFVWDDWVEHINMREDFLKAFHVPWSLRNINEVVSVESLSTYYIKTMKNWHPPETVHSSRKNKGFGIANLSDDARMVPVLQNAFTSIASKTKTPHDLCPPASLSESANVRFYASNALHTEQINTTNNLLGREFSADSLAPLFQGTDTSTFPDFAEVLSSPRYWYHHVPKDYLRNHALENLPSSFLWLIDICSTLAGMKHVEFYDELMTAEKMVLECGWRSMLPIQRTRVKKYPW